ncbi:uncharacterized protein LOC143200480 isoform X3 [Rhynchophorus ferrugineus]|uniref:uncharacterized protein LOC143200480 isoform X3 n=1 Tax=Rhynchophorus ferrugineus TaxID=354439 RepID=UPI003FCD5D6F
MYLEEAVFKHLTCSQCSKYLSISPIKVYPDRSIKCGRCGKADDGGVESQLYNLIIKDAIFPCVNSFDGCPEMRTLSTMSAHEQTCRTEEYSCQLCAAFVGSDPSSGYYLIKCPFHGLIDTFNCPTDQKELRLDFPAVFYFKNMTWSVFVKRKRCLTDLRRKIGIYLQWDNSFPDSDPIENCNVHVAFRIISVVASQTINRVVGDMNLTTGQKCYANVDWDAIANPKMGFVIDGIINVEVLLKIYSCHKRMVKCEDCNRPCVYC